MVAGEAAIALGSNMPSRAGDSASTVEAAIEMLAALQGSGGLARSRLFLTPAWGPVQQPAYVNAAVAMRWQGGARELLDGLLHIESSLGRSRANQPRWGPRTLDLDLLLFGAERIDEPGLRVPHPWLKRRLFVLEPLAEIAGDWPVVDGIGTVADALRTLLLEQRTHAPSRDHRP